MGDIPWWKRLVVIRMSAELKRPNGHAAIQRLHGAHPYYLSLNFPRLGDGGDVTRGHENATEYLLGFPVVPVCEARVNHGEELFPHSVPINETIICGAMYTY
jgi:hypothetical protein